METVTLMALAGLVIGFGFGFVIERTNFCTMGAISDAATFGDFRRFRAWMLAMAVAIVGAQALQAGDLIDLGQSIYLTANFGWFGAIVGGLLFGFGMTIAGGCGTRNLVRFGAGDLRSLVVVLVLGIFAYMTLRGLTGIVRVGLEGATNVDLEAAGIRFPGHRRIAGQRLRRSGGNDEPDRGGRRRRRPADLVFHGFRLPGLAAQHRRRFGRRPRHCRRLVRHRRARLRRFRAGAADLADLCRRRPATRWSI